MTQDEQRARWTAMLVIRLMDRLTDGQRIAVLNAYYDLAFSDGVHSGIELHAKHRQQA